MSDHLPEQMAGIAVFACVVEARSFTGAARMLGTSKSAVSKQIARLETLLDVQLLRRTTRSLSPTSAGQTLYDRTAEAIALCRSAGGEVASLLRRPMGLLRVTAPMTLGRLVVAPALPTFLEAYPEMRVQLVLLDRAVDLAEEGFDIAIRTTRELPAGAVARPLGNTSYLLCAAPGYLARVAAPASPEDLAALNCLRYGEGETHQLWRFDGADGKRSVRVNGNLLVNSSESLRDAVRQGLGVALLPDFVVDDDLRQGSIVRVLPAWTVRPPFGSSVSAVWLPDRHLPPKMRVFVDFMVERLSRASA
ncbi:LysR family transcriptional regulator [Variovorax guangxiensis]|uniref:LysR family transcriptional regulator n=1 Tax=Variovorax guangxiensis TaxID=1775474 RepID=UPI0028573039|nr:LysR family transcriptional regulator [Variovorax guangxiensis]MDR6859926.1 DNA-binding transcriptional LysR family regulator [Variovorax guangxiensis]